MRGQRGFLHALTSVGLSPPESVGRTDSGEATREGVKSPAPFVHAATKATRQFFYGIYAEFVAAYRTAAEKLRAGDPKPGFPVGCFPPAMPFVSG